MSETLWKNLLRSATLVVLAASLTAQVQKPVTGVTTVDEATIAGHPVQLDAQGKLLPWPISTDTGYSYSSHFLTQWTVLWDQFQRQRLHYYYCCFDYDRTTFELSPDPRWANSTGYLRAMMTGFVERLYPYTGDARTLTFLQNFVDYELENGLTPEGYAWSQVPYASANPGARRYTGWSGLGEDYVEPHVVGEDGYAYLRLYEMTGNTKYLRAAIRCADALVKNYKTGDENNSPWPVRVYARDNATGTRAMGPYSANVIEPIMLFDELTRLQQGDTAGYARVRAGAWDWFVKFPLAHNVWVGYFEDTIASMGNMNNVIPLEFARYVLLHPEKDPQWREHARQAIEWVKNTPKWAKHLVHGALITNEQGNGERWCCNDPGQCCDSHTARLAALEALYYAKTGETAYRDAAFRSYNWVTYFQGLSRDAHTPFAAQWWFTDEYADGSRRMMDAFWAVPEWAPGDESHLLGSSSVVTKISYGRGSVTYSTFDAQSTDVLRLDFVPEFVMANGRALAKRNDLDQPGYTFDEATKVLRIRHDDARDVDVQGKGGNLPLVIITFDDPHYAAGTPLRGEYPSGVVNWGEGKWQINVPESGFDTFNLALADAKAESASFRFAQPRVFGGMDVTNAGTADAKLTLHAPEAREQTFTVKAGETRHIRTGWMDPVSAVMLEFQHGEGLRFDNLAWQYEWDAGRPILK